MNSEESKEKLLHALLAEDARLTEDTPDAELLEKINAQIDAEISAGEGPVETSLVVEGVTPPFWKRPAFQGVAACAVIGLLIGAAALIKPPTEDLAVLDADKVTGAPVSGSEDLSPPFKVRITEQKAAETPNQGAVPSDSVISPAPSLSSADMIQKEGKSHRAIIVGEQIADTSLDFGVDNSFNADVSAPHDTTPQRAKNKLGTGRKTAYNSPVGGLMKKTKGHLPVTIPPGPRYAQLNDQTFKSPASAPLSTFSIDTDRASYTNLRNNLNLGIKIHPDSVRVEEMINAFKYDYKTPVGEHPFSVHVETATTPWNPETRLVKIGLKGKEITREERPSTNLVLLADVSGSMNAPNKLGYLRSSFMELIENLDERDTVSIVTYAGKEGVALEPTKVDSEGQQKIFHALETLRAGGSTNGEAGIQLAYSLANKNFLKDGVNRVLLATDGDFNVGVTGDEELLSVVKKGAKKGTFLTVLGFGHNNLNDSMLEKITNDGNGQYYFIDSQREGRRVFTHELTGTLLTIAKDVKIQVEFNPAEVAEYRLLGYANRQLKDEDFNNDRVDAGEIGAGHTVTAFYEIIPGSAKPAVDELIYASPPPLVKGQNQKRPTRNKEKEEKSPEASPSPELLTVKLRYKQPEGTRSLLIKKAVIDSGKDFQSASDDFRFASSVALYGMLLRDAEETGSADFTTVKKIASEATEKQKDREEFLELIEKTPR